MAWVWTAALLTIAGRGCGLRQLMPEAEDRSLTANRSVMVTPHGNLTGSALLAAVAARKERAAKRFNGKEDISDDWVKGYASSFLHLAREPCVRDAGSGNRSCKLITQGMCEKDSMPVTGLRGGYARCFQRKKSCAVVGSSHHLLNASFGQHIDHHDFVIRINAAPDGSDEVAKQYGSYGEHVGTRTDARFVNMYGHIPKTGKPACLFLHEPKMHSSCGRYCWRNPGLCNVSCATGNASFNVERFCTHETCSLENQQCVGAAMENEHDWGKNHVFLDSYFSGIADQVVPHSTAGLKAVIYAMTICDKVSIMGFGPSCGDKVGEKYYPADLTNFQHSTTNGWHHYNKELMLLLEAAEHGTKAIMPESAQHLTVARSVQLMLPKCARDWTDDGNYLFRHIGYKGQGPPKKKKRAQKPAM